MSEQQSTQGTIWAVFGHRLAIEGPNGRVLVDLGPEGAKALTLQMARPLKEGDSIAVSGERKPSEIKVTSITLPDGTCHTVPWKKPPHLGGPGHAPADPAHAVTALERAGYRVDGEAKRRPKHFEIPATKDGQAYEAQFDLDGTIRKAKPVATDRLRAS